MLNQTSDRTQLGASAIVVAASLLLLLGMAAIAVDLGAGYNERRQDQTSADLGAISGALAFISPANADDVADEVLAIVEENLDTTYTASEWETLWSTCTDSGALNPVPAPSAWSSSTLQCISADFETLRVRVPTQILETSLAGAIGFDTISTFAVAEAKLQFVGGGNPKPFGLLNGLPAGETCLTQPATGQAMDACDGNASGNFGTILSDTWNTYGDTVVDCGTPGEPEVQLGVAIGLDHPIGVVAPSLIPGTGAAWQAPPAANTRLDDCTPNGSVGEPSDNTPNYGPPNTVLASTGNNFAKAVEKGLLTGEAIDFPNAANPAAVEPLLIQTANSTWVRTISQRIPSEGQKDYVADNTPLWKFLRPWADIQSGHSGAGIGNVCRQSVIEAAPNQSDAMSACLLAYETAGGQPVMGDLFTDAIKDNPRFGWAPQFHHTEWGSGSHWTPIKSFRPIYINRLWFNCNGQYNGQLQDSDACNDKGKGIIFEPNGLNGQPVLKEGNGGSMKQIRLDQVTGFLLPVGALPDDIEKSFPGAVTGPFEVVLSK